MQAQVPLTPPPLSPLASSTTMTPQLLLQQVWITPMQVYACAYSNLFAEFSAHMWGHIDQLLASVDALAALPQTTCVSNFVQAFQSSVTNLRGEIGAVQALLRSVGLDRP